MNFVKLHPDAALPVRGTIQSAGYDLRALEGGIIPPGQRLAIGTGIGWENMAKGIVGNIRPRSGLAFKNGIDVLAGVIDSDYPGEIKVILLNTGEFPFAFEHGDKIAQLVLSNWLDVLDVKEITEERDGGFGSTGK